MRSPTMRSPTQQPCQKPKQVLQQVSGARSHLHRCQLARKRLFASNRPPRPRIRMVGLSERYKSEAPEHIRSRWENALEKRMHAVNNDNQKHPTDVVRTVLWKLGAFDGAATKAKNQGLARTKRADVCEQRKASRSQVFKPPVITATTIFHALSPLLLVEQQKHSL